MTRAGAWQSLTVACPWTDRCGECVAVLTPQRTSCQLSIELSVECRRDHWHCVGERSRGRRGAERNTVKLNTQPHPTAYGSALDNVVFSKSSSLWLRYGGRA
eukprot:1479498-Prymnesium_polylepis.1